MYLKDKKSGDLVEVLEPSSLVDPCCNSVKGCFHHGEELQDAEMFAKSNLAFPSGENLPQCWVNPNYKN